MALVPASSHPDASTGITLLGYTEFTASVTQNATTAAGADTVVAAAGVVVPAATLICVEFFACAASPAASQNLRATLWQGSTDLGVIVNITAGTAATSSAVYVRRYLTPGAGTYTYTIKTYSNSASSGAQLFIAGAGGAGLSMPGYVRVTSGA